MTKLEFRALIDEAQYTKLLLKLNKEAEDLGACDSETYFFDLGDKLLKVSQLIKDDTAFVSLKDHTIMSSSEFIDKKVCIYKGDFDKMVEIFKDMNMSDTVSHSYQRRHNYRYNGIEIALKYSENWEYHVEITATFRSSRQKEDEIIKVKELAKEINVKLMSEREIAEFIQKKQKDLN